MDFRSEITAKRAATKERLAQLQQVLDDPQPGDDAEAARGKRERLQVVERDLADQLRSLDRQEERAAEAAAAAAAQAAAEAGAPPPEPAPGGPLAGMVGALQERIKLRMEADQAAIAALPCSPGRRAAEATTDQDEAAKATATAARACDTAGAAATCGWATMAWCPRLQLEKLLTLVQANLRASRAPKRAARHLVGHFTRGGDRVPLNPSEPYRVIRAAYEGKGGDLVLSTSRLQLRGNERLLVLHGPPGLGKTVAACYLIARLGGLYLTAYEVAAIGQEPDVPTRSQLRAAPVVVVDQLGDEHAVSAHTRTMLRWLVDVAYNEDHWLVLLGNFGNADEFVAAYDPDGGADGMLAGRLREAGLVAAVNGPDLRAKVQP